MKRFHRRLIFLLTTLLTMAYPLATALADDEANTAITLRQIEATPNPIEWVLYTQAAALILLIALIVHTGRIFFNRLNETREKAGQ